jgi:NADH-quinone oxidoreductase subunit C
MMTGRFLARVLEKAGCACRELETPSPGFACQLETQADEVVGLVRIIAANGFFLESISAVDRLKEKKMDGLYLFNHYEESQRLMIRIEMDRSNPVLPTISRIFPSALWYERELREMFGISVDGCPDTRNLLLEEDAKFHPLRKDFRGRA